MCYFWFIIMEDILTGDAVSIIALWLSKGLPEQH